MLNVNNLESFTVTLTFANILGENEPTNCKSVIIFQFQQDEHEFDLQKSVRNFHIADVSLKR